MNLALIPIEIKNLLSKAGKKKPTLLGLACLAVLFGILMAGLWPFHAPRNQVHWLPEHGGLWFCRHGTALSAGALKSRGELGGNACTIELCLTPKLTWARRTILAFYAPNQTIPFSLHQSNRDLIVESQHRNAEPNGAGSQLLVDRVFRAKHTILIDIASDGGETGVYINGVLSAKSRDFGFTSEDLRGVLVLGNSPVIDDSWSGRLKGLAIWNRFFTRQEALQDYQSWVQLGHPALTSVGSPVALYLFDQSGGQIIRDQTGRQPALEIPKQFKVLHQVFLERPWDEYEPNWMYWESFLINIAGFVPLGLFFFAYFSLVRPDRQAVWMTIFLGTTLSLTIEVLQAFLPTRYSGMTDIMTNTLGTVIGVGLVASLRLVCEGLIHSPQRQVREIATWMIKGASS